MHTSFNYFNIYLLIFSGPLPNSQLPQIEGPKQHLRDFFLKKETAEPRRDIQPQEDISLDGK